MLPAQSSLVTFVSDTLSAIDWSFGVVDWFLLIILFAWLYLIWPSKDIKQLLDDPKQQHRLLWTLLGIFFLWLLNAHVHTGMYVHFLGLVLLMQMFGWRLASIAILLPTLLFSLFVVQEFNWWVSYSTIGMLVPLLLSFAVYSSCFHRLPHNLFVYLFAAGFFNAALVFICHMSLWSVWLWLSTEYPWQQLWDRYLNLLPLLTFPEAIINGMLLTVLVVYRPQWLYDYRDRHYLYPPSKP